MTIDLQEAHHRIIVEGMRRKNNIKTRVDDLIGDVYYKIVKMD